MASKRKIGIAGAAHQARIALQRRIDSKHGALAAASRAVQARLMAAAPLVRAADASLAFRIK